MIERLLQLQRDGGRAVVLTVVEGEGLGSKLLVVRWRTPEGGEDAMEWEVRGLDDWLAALS